MQHADQHGDPWERRSERRGGHCYSRHESSGELLRVKGEGERRSLSIQPGLRGTRNETGDEGGDERHERCMEWHGSEHGNEVRVALSPEDVV